MIRAASAIHRPANEDYQYNINPLPLFHSGARARKVVGSAVVLSCPLQGAQIIMISPLREWLAPAFSFIFDILTILLPLAYSHFLLLN